MSNIHFIDGRYTMTPAEYDKQLTFLLSALLADTGFSKKHIGRLMRKTKECEQHISFYFTRERGLSGNLYSVNPSLSFTFKEVDKLTSIFLGREYDAKWDTGAKPLYTIIPDRPLFRFRYCSDDPLNQYAERMADDCRTYALPYFEKYDSLEKLEAYFDRYSTMPEGEEGFDIVRNGTKGSGRGCCTVAILCLLQKWDKLHTYLETSTLLLSEEKERIIEWLSQHK